MQLELQPDARDAMLARIHQHPPYFGNNDVGPQLARATCMWVSRLPLPMDARDLVQSLYTSREFDFPGWAEQMVGDALHPRVPKPEQRAQYQRVLKRWVLSMLTPYVSLALNAQEIA